MHILSSTVFWCSESKNSLYLPATSQSNHTSATRHSEQNRLPQCNNSITMSPTQCNCNCNQLQVASACTQGLCMEHCSHVDCWDLLWDHPRCLTACFGWLETWQNLLFTCSILGWVDRVLRTLEKLYVVDHVLLSFQCTHSLFYSRSKDGLY